MSLIPRFSFDGKYVVYTVSSRGEVNLYRLPWSNGQVTGAAQLVMKLPFAFSQYFGGNAYDVARDFQRSSTRAPAVSLTYICCPTSRLFVVLEISRVRNWVTPFAPQRLSPQRLPMSQCQQLQGVDQSHAFSSPDSPLSSIS